MSPAHSPPTPTPAASRERRFREILEAALELDRGLPAADRRRALHAQVGDAEPALLDEVLAAVDREGELGGFLARPATDHLEEATRADRPPGRRSQPREERPPALPGFEIEGLLGEGGMGRVYLARQTEPVERRVAVKVIRANVGDPAAAHRFAAEQQALARLNHPAIAQLYDAGTTADERPYVVMEHVDGTPLTEYCQRRRLSLEERLRLFVAVCAGVEHAHRRQLLHRDLKPSNVLVTESDGEPRPKIIDFGVARALDDPAVEDGLTGLRVIGTPHYMSPEALAPVDGPRDLDTRTDVYSLGVLLYELLTGERPFRGRSGDVTSLLRHLGEAAPERPSTRVRRLDRETRSGEDAAEPVAEATQRARRLRGDLDWIALKALARDREDRYGSAAALAEDLERSLRHEPIRARPPSWPDRMGKWVQRHRLATALSALTLTAIVAAVVLSTLAAGRASRAERQAREEAAGARETLGFLVDLFEAARPGAPEGREVTPSDLVALGAERLDERDLPPLQRARLLHTLADVQMRLGDYESGRQLAGEALALREAALPETDADVLASLDLLGNLERRSQHLDAAETHLERLVALTGRPGRPGYEPALHADAMNSLGNLRWRQDRLAEAEELHRRTLELRRGLVPGKRSPASAEARREAELDVTASLNNLGVLLWSQGRFAEAEPPLREAAARAEATLGFDHPLVADALGNLGIVLQRLDRHEEATELQVRSLEIRRRVQGPDHPDIGTSLHNLAVLHRGAGRLEEAETSYRQALEIRLSSLGESHPESLKTATNLALLIAQRGRPAEAEERLREVLEIRRRDLGDGHGDVARAWYHLADPVRRQGGDAAALLRRAAALQEALATPRPAQLADTLHALGELAAEGGDGAAALAYHRRALELRLAHLPAEDPRVAASRQAVAALETTAAGVAVSSP